MAFSQQVKLSMGTKRLQDTNKRAATKQSQAAMAAKKASTKAGAIKSTDAAAKQKAFTKSASQTDSQPLRNLNKVYDTKSQLKQAKQDVRDAYVDSLVTAKTKSHTYYEENNPTTRNDVNELIKLRHDKNKAAYNKKLNQVSKGNKDRASYTDQQITAMYREMNETTTNGRKVKKRTY